MNLFLLFFIIASNHNDRLDSDVLYRKSVSLSIKINRTLQCNSIEIKKNGFDVYAMVKNKRIKFKFDTEIVKKYHAEALALYVPNTNTIFIDNDLIWYNSEFQLAMIHELGHAYGLPHTSSGIMYQRLNNSMPVNKALDYLKQTLIKYKINPCK